MTSTRTTMPFETTDPTAPEAPGLEFLPLAADHYARKARRELAWLVTMTALYFALATRLEIFEAVSRFARGYEYWQLDEWPLTLLVLSIGLLWFGWRRVREARRELQERIRAQAQVAALLAHNRDLAQRLILIQETERRSIARELHDEAGQHCTAIRADAAYIARAHDPHEIGVSAERIDRSAERLYLLVNDMLNGLRPPALDSLGIEAAIQQLCERWEQQTGIACAFVPRNVPARLEDEAAVALFRLVQEALTNVARHALAGHVHVALDASARGDRLQLTIRDDGRGFVPDLALRRGFGLIGMQERVAALHGEIRFESAPGRGSRTCATLPLCESSR